MSQGGGRGQPRRVARAWRRAVVAGAGTVLLVAAGLMTGAGAAAAAQGAPVLAFTPAPFDYGQVDYRADCLAEVHAGQHRHEG